MSSSNSLRNNSQRENGSVRRAAIFGSPLGMVSGNTAASQYLRDEHLQDKLYSVIVEALTSLFNMNCLDALAGALLGAFEELLNNHYYNPTKSRLRELVPEIGCFFTQLPFADAFLIYNNKYHITKRRYIPPTFHEIRHVMNIAQIMAIHSQLRLITFDGDETLYPDGRNFDDNIIAQLITTFLEKGLIVAVVTAAGYGYQTEKYEERLQDIVSRFFVFGGESNYLIQCGEDFCLHPVPESKWRPHVSAHLKPFFSGGLDSEVTRLLSVAAEALEDVCETLSLRALVIRKERAVGLIPGGEKGQQLRPHGSGKATLKPEILEETVYRVKAAIAIAEPPLTIPYCAFNGGHDVWVDVGNKAEGLLVLQSYLNILPEQCLHIGDQFTLSGNDIAARDVSPTLWICNPAETRAVLISLLRQMQQQYQVPSDDELT